LDTKIWLAQVAGLNNEALSASLRQNADTLYEPQQEIQAQIAEFERKLQELQSEQNKLRADADTLDRLTDWLRQDEHNT
jgi:prefoldin subunit 5